MNPSNDFAACFKHLTGHAPFGWQARLYERLCSGDIPPECDIPTGLGKTSVLALWLLALADQAARPDAPLSLPRRLVYIVDRRAVVDQATSEAEQLLQKLCDPVPELAAVAAALHGLAVAPDPEFPFALSTLRGQFADNRRWSHDPARPAIIVGTVDMVGSRLLFQGYGGLGPYGRSQHAALLGQDALLVLDEAQLAPAFLQTLRAVEPTVRSTSGELGRAFAFMSLTATQPRATGSSAPVEPLEPGSPRAPLTLGSADFVQDETVRRRVRAVKGLRFVLRPVGATGKPDDAMGQGMAQEAIRLAGGDGAVVVFVDTVALLEKVYTALSRVPGLDPAKQCLRFTGQMRGKERDEAFKEGADTPANAVFGAFRQQRPRAGRVNRDHPVFLLATSAGEVGVNFDADHAVCDLVSLERMAQRLGRVNRAGDYDGPACVSVFLNTNPDELDGACAVTHRLLQELPKLAGADDQESSDAYLASPEALGVILKGPDARLAFAPTSNPPPLDPARLDDWSLTSLGQDEFSRPQVSYWLRGVTPDEEQAVTQIVWREELRYARDGEDAADLAETCPPRPREILQVPTYRAVNWLLARVRKHLGARRQEADPHQGTLAAIRTTAGVWKGRSLEDFQEKDLFKDDLVNVTLILPTTIGGLKPDGYLDESAEEVAPDALSDPDPESAPDDRAYRRALFYGSPTLGWKALDLFSASDLAAFGEDVPYSEAVGTFAAKLQHSDPQRRYRLKSRKGEPEESVDAGDGETEPLSFRVEYFAPARVYKSQGKVLLDDHLEEARRCAEGIVSRLGLAAAIRDAVVLAAAWHDLGKRREKWQRAIGNTVPGLFLAKSDRPFYDHNIGAGYRHEFGSMMDVLCEKEDELRTHPEPDLLLHLIAAHHGHARPGFEEKAYDVPEHLLSECAGASHDAELRFDRLQRRFGWWGLAYLEALVKCADGIASERAANPAKSSSQP